MSDWRARWTAEVSRNIPLTRDRITAVEGVYDTTVEHNRDPGLLTEVHLHSGNTSTHLVDADLYSPNEWHLCNESIVALISPTADTLS